MTDLAERLELVGRGRPLPATGEVTLLPGPAGGAAVAAVLGFTAHHLIAADLDPDWLRSALDPTTDNAEIGRPMQPGFLAELGVHLHARPGGQDVLLVSTGTSDLDCLDPDAANVNPAALDHPRADRALRYRDDVRVATKPGGLVTIGRGLADRWEISIEVETSHRGGGMGRALAEYGRTLVPGGALLWAQVHPANVASLRVFLAAGYRPVGAEVLFTRASGAPEQ